MVSAVVHNRQAWISVRFNANSAALRARGTTSATRAAALCLCCLVSAALASHAYSQSAAPESTAAPASLLGFVSPDEINKIVRAAGFTPLGPARRQGTTYELRATDYRDVLMRVVVDGRSGAIRAVNRIVPARPEGVVGVMPPPDIGPAPYKPPASERLPSPPPAAPSPPTAPSAHDTATATSAIPSGPRERELGSSPAPSTTLRGTYASPDDAQPLPRPRPANLTTQKARVSGKVPNAASAAPLGPQIAPRPAPVTSKRQPQIATPN
jgi:hypothetical protein